MQSRETFVFRSLPSCGACLGYPTINHHPSRFDATLSLGLAAIRDGVFIRFTHLVRITLCDTFLYAKTLRQVTFIHNNVKFTEKNVWARTQMVQNSKKDVQRTGRSSMSDEMIAKVEKAMTRDRSMMIRKLSEMMPDVTLDHHWQNFNKSFRFVQARSWKKRF